MEGWTIERLISLLALVVAVFALVRTWAVQKEQLKLQRVAGELTKKQLEMVAREEASSSRAVIIVEIVRSANAHEFVVKNIGAGRARDVRFLVKPRGRGSNPIIEADYRSKVPIPILDPGGRVGVHAVFETQCATAFDVVLTWVDGSGGARNEEAFVAL